MTNMNRCITGILLTLFLVGTSMAKSGDQAIQIDLKAGGVSTQIQQIQKAILEPEYVEMKPAARADLQAQLDILAADDLDADVAKQAQDKSNAILSQAFKDSRLVCRLEKKIGSVRNIRVCRTVASMKEDHQNNQNANASMVVQ